VCVCVYVCMCVCVCVCVCVCAHTHTRTHTHTHTQVLACVCNNPALRLASHALRDCQRGRISRQYLARHTRHVTRVCCGGSRGAAGGVEAQPAHRPPSRAQGTAARHRAQGAAARHRGFLGHRAFLVLPVLSSYSPCLGCDSKGQGQDSKVAPAADVTLCMMM